jgi:uncharacterized membrane protein
MRLLALVFGCLLAAVGTLHLLRPAPFVRQVPVWVPHAELAVLVSGVAEIAIGLALAVNWHPRWAGAAAAALIASFLPVHIEAVRSAPAGKERRGESLRFPLNAVIIAIAVLLAFRG